MINLVELLKQNPLIAGPLAGYTCAPMRRLFWKFKEPAFCYTEMISAHHLTKAKRMPNRFVYRDPIEKRLCWQLSGHDAATLKQACIKAQDMGADLIDLNCGCPKGKIRAKKCGSYHVEHLDHLQTLVAAMREVTQVPLIVKIRLHPSGDLQKTFALLDAMHAIGVDAVAIHGRAFADSYDIPVNLAALKLCCDYAKLPIILNGDIDQTNAKMFLDETNAAGLMFARFLTGQPWIIEQTHAVLNGLDFQMPTNPQRGKLFLEHVKYLCELENEKRAVLQSRKIIKYYGKGILSHEQLLEAYQIDQLTNLQAFVLKCF